MKTNFFHQIQALNVKGNLTMNILSGEDGKMTVSVVMTPTTGSKEFAHLPPLIFRRTADELAEGFFGDIAEPLAGTTELFNNIDDYKKSLETAKAELAKKTAEQKEKAAEAKNKKPATETNNKEDKKKAYEAIMKQVTEMNDACKYEEALALLPEIEDYPDKEAEIKKRTEDLSRKRDQKQLFI